MTNQNQSGVALDCRHVTLMCDVRTHDEACLHVHNYGERSVNVGRGKGIRANTIRIDPPALRVVERVQHLNSVMNARDRAARMQGVPSRHMVGVVDQGLATCQ